MRISIKLKGIRAGPNFAVKFGSTDQTFRAGFTAFQTVTGTNPEYTGPTTVTPSGSVQTLPTAKRLMRQDVTVKKIPQYEVSNDYGGYTLIIGDEYYNAQ